jgi:hypothetical protein
MAKKSGKTKRKVPKSTRSNKTLKAATTKKVSKASEEKPNNLASNKQLPSILKIARSAAEIVWDNRRLFIGIIIVYALLNLILVQGLSNSTDIGSLKSELSKAFKGDFGSVLSGLSIFVVLVGSAGNGTSQTAGIYQIILGLIMSLAIIWALRQIIQGNKLGVRDAFYKGLYPLVPFILVLLFIGLELLPLLLGSLLLSVVTTNGIIIGTFEELVLIVIFLALALLSLYLISSSIFGLYIVTLPDMTPMKALRSARELVGKRRWIVLRKILGLPFLLLIVSVVIMLPIILWLSVLAQWLFFLLTMVALLAVHAYLYTLYRELLND